MLMVRCSRFMVFLAELILLPTAVFAQAAISGTAKDASGAVLPGVTVEAASPVLIEKVRSVVTDGSGRYQIVDLRPGAYSVTFSLAGFNTFKRDGVELTGSITVSVDAELRVGAIEETITVTGETPTVDVQSTTKQRVITADIIDTIPTGRSFATLGVLIPGIVSSGNDVGGSLGDPQASVSSHGGRSNDQRIMQGGLPINDLQTAGAGQSGAVPNVGAAAEISLDFGALSAEQATGGVSINFVPRDGGNNFKGSVFMGGSNESLAGSNFTQRVKDRGLTANGRINKNWDFNPGFGGPIKRDKLWFYATFRYEGAKNYAAGIRPNKNAFQPNVWTYEPDTSKETFGLVTDLEDEQFRVTYQATQKDKFTFSFANNTHCRCPFGIGATIAPEASSDRRFPQQRTLIGEWKSPVTNRLLVEATAFHKTLRWGTMHLRPSSGGGSLDEDVFEGITPAQIAIYPTLIGVTEQSSGLNYHGPGTASNGVLGAWNNTYVPTYTYRAAVSYVTGSHNFKAGFQDSFGYLKATTYALDVPYRYRFLNGVPNQITQFATPWTAKSDQRHDMGIFAQDRWTVDRMTFTGAIRFDYYKSDYPEQKLGPAPLAPNRNLTFPYEENLNWKDLSFRSGWAYDVGGNGKTALRVSLNKYLSGQALGGFGSNTNPILRLTNTTTRTWNDRGGLGIDGDFIPQCDLTIAAANGECAAMANSAFGTSLAGQVRDLELRTGTGKRGFNYELSAAVQREILPRVSADVGYFRRWYGNFAVTDDLNRVPSDYDVYSITVPSDSRLPGGGGNIITGLYDLKPQFFGQPSNLSTVLSKNYGKQIEHWDGVDIGAQARLPNGLMIQGGTSTGKTTTDNCEIVAKLPEMLVGAGAASSSTEFCHVETPWQTQLKGLGSYTIPRIDVSLAATFQSGPGNTLTAAYIVPTAVAAQSLGRPLSGNAANVTVNVIPAIGQTNNNPVPVVGAGAAQTSTLYGERLNQIDLRVGKIFRFGQRRASVNMDLYNITNSDTVTATNNNYATLWRPTAILQARFIRFSTQIDF
ncbi:MAG: carboxypeptidase regulatory-like domain-containing protein [Vicinamibacterales bacterium]